MTDNPRLDAAAHKLGRLVRRHNETGGHYKRRPNSRTDPDGGCTLTCLTVALDGPQRNQLGRDNIVVRAIELGLIDERHGRFHPGPTQPAAPHQFLPATSAAIAAAMANRKDQP